MGVTQVGRTTVTSMGICRNHVDLSREEQFFTETPHHSPKGPRDTSGCDLNQAPGANHVLKQIWSADDRMISLWMRQNSRNPKVSQVSQKSIQWEIDIVGQFKEQVSPVGNGLDFAVAKTINQRLINSDISSRKKPQRDLSILQVSLGLVQNRTNKFGRVSGMASPLMRCGNDPLKAVLHRRLGHGQSLLPIRWSVVQTGQKMAVNINESRGQVFFLSHPPYPLVEHVTKSVPFAIGPRSCRVPIANINDSRKSRDNS